MSELIQPFAEWAAALLEALGIGIIILFGAYALIAGATDTLRRRDTDRAYHVLRERLGRGILLGLEFLVAADIIHTVAVELTFRTVGVLAVVVAIRTFLSFTLELELSGKWPWQKHPAPQT